jgi:hypothetical protein
MELIKDLLFSSLGYFSAIKVRPLAKSVTLQLAKTTLVILPLVGEKLATGNTAYRDNHSSSVS